MHQKRSGLGHVHICEISHYNLNKRVPCFSFVWNVLCVMLERVKKTSRSYSSILGYVGTGVSWWVPHRCVCLYELVRITPASAGVSGWVIPYDYNARSAIPRSEGRERTRRGREDEFIGCVLGSASQDKRSHFIWSLNKTAQNKVTLNAHFDLGFCL